MTTNMATCKLVTTIIAEIDNQVRIGNYLSRSEFIRYAIKTLEKNPLFIETMAPRINQFMKQILDNSNQTNETKTKVVSFKLPKNSANQLNALSADRNLTRSEVIRLGIVLLLLDENNLRENPDFHSCPLCGTLITEVSSLPSEIDISSSQVPE
ncbi:MAG: ribbon-helix-helix protein, CopG family [Candidatus Hodarchaeota archaeon]